MLLSIVRGSSPKWSVPWVILGNPNSPLCGWSADQPKLFTEQMRRGGAVSVLMGHARAQLFYSVNDVTYSFREAQEGLGTGRAAGPMVIFSCHSGDFTSPGGCMTKSFVLSAGGPVAAIGATTESHPLPNYYSGVNLLKQLGGKQRRVGDVWLATQRTAMDKRSPLIDRLLRDVEGKLEPEIDVAKLRRDQMLMYALLGDPATRMRLPEQLEVTVERKDGVWQWKASTPAGAKLLRVEYRPDNPSIPKLGEDRGEAEMRRLFKETNATFEYTALASPGAKGAWRGKIDKEGWVRFVAIGPKKMHVAVMQLKVPEEAPK
jgi:hypothetical protein